MVAAWLTLPPRDQLKQISELTKTINTGLLEVSVLGEMGCVSQAYNELFKIRTAKHQKETCERELKTLADTSGPSGHQKLQVCDVCGAYLSRLDNDRRLADHFYGKMHMGYSDMRKTYKKLSEELKGRPPPARHDDGGYGDDGGWGGRGGGGKGGDCGKEADRCQKEKVCSFARFELSIVHLLELDLELYTFCSTRP